MAFGCALLVAAFFSTPVHLRAVAFAWEHLRYHSVLGNPDHAPLSFSLFDVEHSGHGLSYWSWLFLSAAAAYALWLARRKRIEIPLSSCRKSTQPQSVSHAMNGSPPCIR